MSTPDLVKARELLDDIVAETPFPDEAHLVRVLAAEYDRRGAADVDHWRTRALEAESRVDGQAWVDLIASNERMGKALTEIGLALGLPTPSARLHWGAPEILRRISAQQAECERLHPEVDARPVFCEAAAEWDHTWVVIEGVEQCSECRMAAARPALATSGADTLAAELQDLVSRIENLRIHRGNVGDYREAVIARLDELGDISRTLQRLAARPPHPATGTAALLALCAALDRLPASEGGSGRSVSVEEIRRLLRAPAVAERWRAPYTEEQAASLNAMQTDVAFHPYTCGNDHDEPRELLAVPGAGWVCPTCTYTQDWAHALSEGIGAPRAGDAS